MTRRIRGLSEVPARAMILDLWGVIHDGVTPYPDAHATLSALRRSGGKTVLLSNAPRRSEALIAQLESMGLGRDLYDHVLSSGEAVHQELAHRTDPFYAQLGRRFHHMGPERDRNIFEGLDLACVPIEQADFIINTGPSRFEETVEDYLPVMEQGIKRRLPMICANPDKIAIRQGRPVICAGALAERYTQLGGEVSQRGKPDPAIYTMALNLLEVPPMDVVAVGDALHTDIKGGNDAGIRTVLVTQGIHAAELGILPGEEPEEQKLRETLVRHGETPWAVMAGFCW